MGRSLTARTVTPTTRTTRCPTLVVSLRMTMELAQPPIIGLPPVFALHALKHHSQVEKPHANLPPKAPTSLRRSPKPLIRRSNLAARPTAPPPCSNRSSSFSSSLKFVISIALSFPSAVNSITQNAAVSMLIIVLTDFKINSTSIPQSPVPACSGPPPMSPGMPPQYQFPPLNPLLTTTIGMRPPSTMVDVVHGLGTVIDSIMMAMPLR